MEKLRATVYVLGLALGLTAVGCTESPLPNERDQRQAGSLSVPTVARGRIEFVQGYQRGYDLAKKIERPMLIFFTAQWCDYCHQMERDAFTDQTVSDLARQFLCILVDADSEPEVCQEFDVRGYPTIQFMTSGGVPLNRLTGRRQADQLASQMEAALQAAVVRAQQTGQSVQR